MSLFLNTSSLNNHYSDCHSLDVGEIIERDCLSVLHKLHDQVNGLQLVQVVVQPLARLFNPASLATLVSTAKASSTPSSTPPSSSSASVNDSNLSSPNTTTRSAYSNATTPTSSSHQNLHHHHPHSASGSHSNDLDGVSTVTATSSTGISSAAAGLNLPSSHHGSSVGAGGGSHSRTQSFVSASGGNTNNGSNNNNATSSNISGNANAYSNNPLQPPISTYMMSPDTAQALIARLDTDRDVNWLMEIIGYGLSMPFSLTGEQDSVKDCCTIYCEWLASALLPYNENNQDSKYQQLSKLVPVPIKKEPNRYARKMMSHLYNVFLPRQSLQLSNTFSNQREQSDATLTAVSRQAVLCHRVLRTIENIAQNQANLMDNQTWDHLLALLLTVNDKLLSAPTEPDNIGTQLHDRILGVLFDLMLLASAKTIPSTSLWRTFHAMSLNWRHRPALVDHWKRVTLLLTKRIASMPTTTPRSSKESEVSSIQQQQNLDINSSNMFSINPSAIEIAATSMNYENLTQTWFRFLTLIGNPVELSDPNVISRTDEFYHAACASDNVLDPRQHPCLSVLPHIFMNSMTGLREIIESFLGTYQQFNEDRLSGDLPTPDRHSYNPSARGSIISLSNNTPASSSTVTQNMSHQGSHQQSHQQPQAVTPTQVRKHGIKSIAMKGGKVIPFSASSGAHTSNASSQPADSGGLAHEPPKSGSLSSSGRNLPQFMQPRPSLTSLSSRTSGLQQLMQSQFKLSAERPKCNSILHIFGDWLFSAALIGSDLNHEIVDKADSNPSGPNSLSSSSTTTEVSGFRGLSPSFDKKQIPQQQQKPATQLLSSSSRQQTLKQQDISAPLEKITLDQPLSADSFESGQAEAMALLCKIFSSKSSSEDVSPVYLSRFYLCLQHCLTFGSEQGDPRSQQSNIVIKRQLLSSVLINSTTLLQKDLDGINLLIPSFIKAIEFVFECSDKEIPIQPPPRQNNKGPLKYANSYMTSSATNYDLRRASILTLLNLLAYPYHFQNLVIRNCLDESSPTSTFGSLRPRLLKLLFVALQTESDPTNMQILFGGLSLAIHDLESNASKVFREESAKSTKKGESTHSSLDASSTNKQDDTSSQSSFVFNSNDGFLIKSLHVTCHLLINTWKHDTQVSLAALELLTTIARVSTSSSLVESVGLDKRLPSRRNNNNNNNNNDRIEMRNEYKQTTKWICDYICNQCSRPPPAHSRDMHSTIVAAYQCLSVWFYNHPYLLHDENCVYTLMEVIELGVSGQKSASINVNPSTGVGSKTTISKNNKIMKPSSMRVREAAESLMNICMVRARTPLNDEHKVPAYDTVLDEHAIAELFGGIQHKASAKHAQDAEARRLEPYRMFKYFSDEDSVVFGFFEGLNHDPINKDSVICLLRTPFGKHCWRLKFNYCTEKSRDKIIANKTLGLIKRPFQQSTTPTYETRMFNFPGGQNKSLYFNNTAKFFPETCENLLPNPLDQLVTSLDDYVNTRGIKDSRLKNDLDKMNKIFNHQVLAEQKVISECLIRIKRIDCEEPQPMNDLEAARIIVTQLGLKASLSSFVNGDKISPAFVSDLKLLDQQSVRICDSVNIFYVRRNRTSPKEILESVRDRHNVSLNFFEWILELGQPTVVKNHCRWTGKVSTSWNSRALLQNSGQGDTFETSLSRNQMLTSDHGGAIFDGHRMTLYWNDMCQELAFLVPHRIERPNSNPLQTPSDPGHNQPKLQTPSECDLVLNSCNSSTGYETGFSSRTKSNHPDNNSALSSSNPDHNSDVQSLCSVTSDTSSHSNRAPSQHSSPRDPSSDSIKDQRDNVSLSRQSVTTQKRKLTTSSYIIGCDTNIIICWLECSDDMPDVPCETLLVIAENGYFIDDELSNQSTEQQNQRPRSRDFVKYFISPMKNGLYRINLITSFGRPWLALPLVDGMTVSKGILSSLMRESVLNLCRRRRLDADCYQPPHVKRRLRIQELCNIHKISSRYESTEFYNRLLGR